MCTLLIHFYNKILFIEKYRMKYSKNFTSTTRHFYHVDKNKQHIHIL